MEIVHSICFWCSWDKSLPKELVAANIKIKETAGPDGKDTLIVFDISESHPLWNDISRRIKSVKGRIIFSDSIETYFSDDEILGSDWSRMYVENVKKYPEPSRTWVKEPVNYDDFCRNCGTHVQARHFRIQKEPSWGIYDFFTFFWGHAVFCSSAVMDEFARNNIQGLRKMELLINKSSAPARDIFQLLPANTTRGGLIVPKEMKVSFCRHCHTKKYSYHEKGRMQYRRDAIVDDMDILYTQEWIGVGRKDAWREVMVSKKLAGIVLKKGWKGVRFKAVELV